MILVGPPGCGKSAYAEQLVNEYDNTIHIASDSIRKELWGDEAIQGDNNEVFSTMNKRTIDALNNGKNVVYDATNMTRKDRAYIISQCPKFVMIEAHIVWAPIETCLARDNERGRTVGKEVIDRMLKRFQAPYYDEGIDYIHIHYSVKDFSSKEYACNVVNSMDIPHDNPHHTLNIDDHCAEAEKYMESKSDCDLLWFAAMLHDIGKPYVKSFIDSKGNACEYAHYYQHQCVGAWMVYGMYDYCAYPQSQLPDAAWLISTHMEPFFESKYYKNLPAYLKEKVDLLHEADKAAH